MNTLKKYAFELKLLAFLIMAGQLFFAVSSGRFTEVHYEGRIYATTATEHRNEDLHKLNEAAHYFGQTMIGWTKFPHFMGDLITASGLPADASLSAHIQERQNIIFTVYSKTDVAQETLVKVKDFIQGKIDEYNAVSQTKFVLSNLDYEHVKIEKSYGFGAMLALGVSLVLWAGLLFLKKEFF